MKLGYLQELLPDGDRIVNYVDRLDSLSKLAAAYNEQVQQPGSILNCNLKCAKDQCLDLFKKKTPFQVALGCVRSACNCNNLDMSKNAY